MKIIPNTENALLLRTDFSDDNLWLKMCQVTLSPKPFIYDMEVSAEVEPYSDRLFENATAEQILAALPKNRKNWFIFIVDSLTLIQPDFPILCVDLCENIGTSFRVIASELYQIESNLSTFNTTFGELKCQVDKDGIYRQKLF